MSLKSMIYKLLKYSNDANAVKKWRISRRIARRAAGKATGRAFRKIFG